MTRYQRVIANLVVVAAGESLVSEKVDRLEAFFRDVTEAEGLVPAHREDVKGDLTACESSPREQKPRSQRSSV